jgi:drug/metabolite transporter (DMT)-like permease
VGILFGLLAAIGQAAGYTYAKKSYEELPPSIVFFFDACFGILIWVPVSLILGVDFTQLLLISGFALLSALLSEAFVFYALSKGILSISGTIFASYPIYTIFFSFFINSERLNPIQWSFILLTIIGTLLSCLPKEFNKSELKKKIYVLWPLAAAIAVGFSDSLSKNIIDKTSMQTFLFALGFAQIPVAIAYLKLEKQSVSQFSNTFRHLNKYKFALIGSLCNVLAVMFMWIAFSSTLASIASPITATYPALIVILALLFLKEKPTLTETLGIIITLCGIIGVSFIV